MIGRSIVLSVVIAAAVLLYIVESTTPSTIGPVGLLAVFFLLYIICLGITTALLYGSSLIVARLSRPFTTRRPYEQLSLRRAYYFSTIIALAPVMLLAMQSIGSLGVYESALVIIFLGVGILYVAKRTH